MTLRDPKVKFNFLQIAYSHNVVIPELRRFFVRCRITTCVNNVKELYCNNCY